MISVTENGGHTAHNLKGFTVDSEDDIENLPIEGLAMGSYAFVIETGDVYMFSPKKRDWIKI